MLKIGDRIKMIKDIFPEHCKQFNVIGMEFEIIDIKDKVIWIKCDFGIGGLYEHEFDTHFEKIESKKWTNTIVYMNNNAKKWTPWIETKSGFSYRTDNVKYVKVKKDGIVVKASTHPCDTFNLAKGIAVCLQKIENKKVNEKAKSVEIKYSKIIYDSKFDILYIDFIGRAVDEYVEKINNEIYLRKNLYTDDVIGIYIENYRNQVLEATGLGKKLIKDGLY